MNSTAAGWLQFLLLFAALAACYVPLGNYIAHIFTDKKHWRVERGIYKLTGRRFVPFDPVLRARDSEPERRRAWLRDQYEHPEEHRHTVAEVQRWFRENDIDYLRTYPDALIGAEPLEGAGLFEPAEDDWGFENVLSQMAWATTLGKEGGLWITVGQKAGRARA